ncbi:MAG TPA: hypothetical protein VHO50_12545 [Bacteroidales bacterium]|nr:hypothetical protein [Bacteroidales bacterium]
MENTEDKYKNIKGWGIDSDPKNEPTYPIKNYTGDDHKRLNYEKPKQQANNNKVLHSNERPTISSVFGTSVPLSGLSGLFRRLAFRYSESSFGHWLPLIFADRINVWEGYIKDFGKGRLPNIFRERGWASELKHNRKKFITQTTTKVVVSALLITAVLLIARNKRKKRH